MQAFNAFASINIKVDNKSSRCTVSDPQSSFKGNFEKYPDDRLG